MPKQPEKQFCLTSSVTYLSGFRRLLIRAMRFCVGRAVQRSILLLLLLGLSLQASAQNRAPWLEPVSRHSLSLGQALDIFITPFDPDGDAASLEIVNAPLGASLSDVGNGTHRLTWRPSASQLGDTAILLRARDAIDASITTTRRLEISVTGGGAAAQQFNAANTATLDQSTARQVNLAANLAAGQRLGLPELNDIAIGAGETVELRITPVSDNGIPAFYMVAGPAGASLDDNRDGSRTFRWNSQSRSTGSYPVTLEVQHPSDSGLRVSRQFNINVQASVQQALAISAESSNGVNVATDFAESPSTFNDGRPVIQPLADQFIEPGGAVIFRVTPIDPDGTPATLVVNPLPASATFDDNGDGTRTFFWQTGEGDRGPHRITFTATDGLNPGLQHSESLLITVGSGAGIVNSPAPVANTASNTAALDNSVANVAANVQNVSSLGIAPMQAQQIVAGSNLTQVVQPLVPQGRGIPALVVVNPPAGSSFNDNGNGGRIFSWKPDSAGRHVIEFEAIDASDSSQRARASLTIDVVSQGDSIANTLASATQSNTDLLEILPIPEQLGRPNRSIIFNVPTRHPGRAVPTLVLRNEPRGAALYDNGDGSRFFAWTPNNDQTGIFTFDVIAVDAQDTNLVAVRPIRLVITDDVAATVAIADPGTSPLIAETRADAARFLARATFGAREQDLVDLVGKPYEQWINDQFGTPISSHLNRLDGYLWDRGLFNISTGDRQLERSQLRSDAFWDVVVKAPDQLRQRVAFALSQILVISDADPALENRVRGFAHYHDTLLKHAFGNYRQLLTEVALSPMMGDFLSSRRNEKANPAENIEPDENFARELMQLFTIGLDVLRNDGTRERDSQGNRLLAYSQEDVINFARVFTGWNYGDSAQMRDDRRTLESEILPMKAYEEFHDTEPKRLLNGITISGGRSARNDLELALDNLFQHSNTPPFISRQLIQRLVTSNPTPAYIERVANVFRNNGNGTRGDLSAVVKAILLDPEALNGHQLDPVQFGKIKEPVIKIASVWRAFNAQGRFNRFRYADSNTDFAQQAYSAPSVFNFYSPDYRPPGPIGQQGLVAPEAQLVNESTVIRGGNRLFDYAFEIPLGNDEIFANQHQISLNLGPQLAIARQPAELVENLNQLLMAGQMSEHMKDVLTRLAGRTPLDDNGSNRVRETLYMILVSPEFSIQR